MRVLQGTRLFQTLSNQVSNEFSLLNTRTGKHLIINAEAASIFHSLNRSSCGIKLWFLHIFPYYRSFFSEFKKEGFLVKTSKKTDVFFCPKYKKNPLSALNIELTNYCNLDCVHCYGSFGKPKKSYFITHNQVVSLFRELDELNTSEITLTGGECTINPEFEKIALSILDHGYKLWIMTNGLETKKIISFAEKAKQYHYNIKISLDGFKTTHNSIRNNLFSYDNVIYLLEYFKNTENVQVYLSSILMRDNYDEYEAFKEQIEEKYPNIIHTTDLIFPSGNAVTNLNHSFTISDLKEIAQKYSFVFRSKEARKNGHRCTGGISQATLMSDGRLKICNPACDDKFFFKNNVFETGIIRAWEDCGTNIERIRNEKNKETIDCIKCTQKNSCITVDCRVLANLYYSDTNRSSPITCFITKGCFE